MRLSALVFATSILGVCAMPARADYVFDFQFGATSWDANHGYAPSEIVYRGTTLGTETTLTYVSGDVDGFRPATVNAVYGYYRDIPLYPQTEWSAYGPGDGSDFAVNGFDMAAYGWVTQPGAYTDGGATLTLAIPGSYFSPGDTSVYDLTVFDSATLTIAQTPEPSSLLLLGTGVLGTAGVVRRRLGV